DGRIRDARIDVAERLQVEEARRVIGAVEHERGRLVDRQRTRARGRVRNLAGVQAERVESEFTVGHGRGTACSQRGAEAPGKNSRRLCVSLWNWNSIPPGGRR